MRGKWPWIVLGLVVILAAGGVALFSGSGRLAPELVELVAQGGETKLRHPMRPARGGTRMIIFALDGVGDDELRWVIRAHFAPHIAALLGAEGAEGSFEHGYAVPNVISILPSTTMAAWSSIYTGEPAGRTGVPGNEWFVREERRFMAPAPVSIVDHAHTVKMFTDGLVGNAIRVPTLYELLNLRSYVSLAPVYRGADLFTTPDPTAVAELFLQAAKGLVSDESVKREAYSEIDQESVEDLIEEIRQRGVPDIQVVYFPGIDLFTHVAKRPLEQEKLYLRDILDPLIGKVLNTYQSAGVLDSTYVLFVADHGHTPVVNDDRHSLGTDGEDEPPALIRRTGFRMRPFVLNPDEQHQDYQAAVAYQGAIAYVYLADRSTCPRPGDRCAWERAPRFDEDVLPVVRAFHEANETGALIPELRGTLDLIFARSPRAPGEDALPFKVYDGHRLVAIADYFEQHPRPDLIRLEERMNGLSAGPYGHRAGDVLLLARSGAMRPIEERFYFSGLYRSWHGSPEPQDSKVPLIVARKQSSGSRLRAIVQRVVGPSASQLDVVPLVRELLKQPATSYSAGPASGPSIARRTKGIGGPP